MEQGIAPLACKGPSQGHLRRPDDVVAFEFVDQVNDEVPIVCTGGKQVDVTRRA